MALLILLLPKWTPWFRILILSILWNTNTTLLGETKVVRTCHLMT